MIFLNHQLYSKNHLSFSKIQTLEKMYLPGKFEKPKVGSKKQPRSREKTLGLATLSAILDNQSSILPNNFLDILHNCFNPVRRWSGLNVCLYSCRIYFQQSLY